jgi:hypothetical protein
MAMIVAVYVAMAMMVAAITVSVTVAIPMAMRVAIRLCRLREPWLISLIELICFVNDWVLFCCVCLVFFLFLSL